MQKQNVWEWKHLPNHMSNIIWNNYIDKKVDDLYIHIYRYIYRYRCTLIHGSQFRYRGDISPTTW